jgi:hypothetical protein
MPAKHPAGRLFSCREVFAFFRGIAFPAQALLRDSLFLDVLVRRAFEFGARSDG